MFLHIAVLRMCLALMGKMPLERKGLVHRQMGDKGQGGYHTLALSRRTPLFCPWGRRHDRMVIFFSAVGAEVSLGKGAEEVGKQGMAGT